MEKRIITIVSTANSSKKTIETDATTLGELKAALRSANISYDGMDFFEGLTKSKLVDDASLLPHDVPFKGQTTNELVFMLTNSNKKIRSGATRTELYNQIKSMGLAEKCREVYGKNFTLCKTFELESLINEASVKTVKVTKDKNKPEQVTENNCKKVLVSLIDILYNEDVIFTDEYEELMSMIGDSSDSNDSSKETSYSNDDLKNMFDFVE